MVNTGIFCSDGSDADEQLLAASDSDDGPEDVSFKTSRQAVLAKVKEAMSEMKKQKEKAKKRRKERDEKYKEQKVKF